MSNIDSEARREVNDAITNSSSTEVGNFIKNTDSSIKKRRKNKEEWEKREAKEKAAQEKHEAKEKAAREKREAEEKAATDAAVRAQPPTP
jgi:membrane protein involved in colicin uptake